MADVAAAEIFENLRRIAPNLAFSTKWTEDPSFVWDGDGPDPADEGLVAYDVDVYARAIVKGVLAEGRQSLGGTYDDPNRRDPNIHGYLPQMLEEALMELYTSIPIYSEASATSHEPSSSVIRQQALQARHYLRAVMKQSSEA